MKGAKAKAEVVDLRTGQVVGGAEAYCMRDEENWKEKPWFQLASMAQTRAGAKALRNVLAWVVVLAGYRPTPAEELTQTSQTVKPRVESSPESAGGSSPGSQSKSGGSSSPTPASSPPQGGSPGTGPSTPQGASPTPSNPDRPTREDYQKLLKAAANCGFLTLDKDGKKCVDYHHLGEFLKAQGFPQRVREMNKEQCYLATLTLETYSRYLFPGRE